MMSKEHLETLIQETLAGKHTFPEHLMHLMSQGGKKYQIDLEKSTGLYYGEEASPLVKNLPLQVQLQFSAQWTPELIKAAITEVQKKVINYQQFLEAIAQAGVRNYTVEIFGKRTIYYGLQQEYVEPFPSALISMLKL